MTDYNIVYSNLALLFLRITLKKKVKTQKEQYITKYMQTKDRTEKRETKIETERRRDSDSPDHDKPLDVELFKYFK